MKEDTINRAFNTYGWENFADPLYQGVPGDLFYSGPAGSSQTVVEQLISEVGLRPVRVGDADQADLVDSLLPFWFTLAQPGHPSSGAQASHTLNRVSASVCYCSFVQPGAERRRA